MFTISHTDDSWEENPPIESLSALYDELLTSELLLWPHANQEAPGARW